jgi:hypothetical protein
MAIEFLSCTCLGDWDELTALWKLQVRASKMGFLLNPT